MFACLLPRLVWVQASDPKDHSLEDYDNFLFYLGVKETFWGNRGKDLGKRFDNLKPFNEEMTSLTGGVLFVQVTPTLCRVLWHSFRKPGSKLTSKKDDLEAFV